MRKDSGMKIVDVERRNTLLVKAFLKSNEAEEIQELDWIEENDDVTCCYTDETCLKHDPTAPKCPEITEIGDHKGLAALLKYLIELNAYNDVISNKGKS